ncbi:MFS transporter [Pelagovum pacificum]|uniref:MFS transporter n=1 Tax=Pelagovum pacificum TaxID=2588711 RepID=A0A5C5GEU4_9RHOB|nr:MFS transporter [Pelagovum pacificum]QQA43600.1 MFS transporter [Pelagovum pacificum]TNY33265.1 MFS transporter [Pelagovum pacificum]
MTTLFRDPRAYALLLAATLTIMSNATISPALPLIEQNFSDTPNAGLLTRLLVTAPSLVVAFLAPFAGGAADRFGRRRQLLVGTILYGIAGTAGLWLDSLMLILVSRLVLGAAVAMIMTSQSALIGDFYDGDTRARFMGYQMSAVNFGGFIFISLAGWFAAMWAMLPFAIYGFAFALLPLLIFGLPRTEVIPTADESSPQHGEGANGWKIMVGAIAVFSAVTFILFYVLPTQVAYYLSSLGRNDPTEAGHVMASLTLCAGLSAMTFGPVRGALGQSGTPALGLASMSIGFWVLHTSEAIGLLMTGAAIVGIGMGYVMPCFVNLALGAAPPHRRGMATGIVTTAIFLGQFLSPLASQPAIAAFGYSDTFAGSSVLLMIMAIVVLIGLRERTPAPSSSGAH